MFALKEKKIINFETIFLTSELSISYTISYSTNSIRKYYANIIKTN